MDIYGFLCICSKHMTILRQMASQMTTRVDMRCFPIFSAGNGWGTVQFCTSAQKSSRMATFVCSGHFGLIVGITNSHVTVIIVTISFLSVVGRNPSKIITAVSYQLRDIFCRCLHPRPVLIRRHSEILFSDVDVFGDRIRNSNHHIRCLTIQEPMDILFAIVEFLGVIFRQPLFIVKVRRQWNGLRGKRGTRCKEYIPCSYSMWKSTYYHYVKHGCHFDINNIPINYLLNSTLLFLQYLLLIIKKPH